MKRQRILMATAVLMLGSVGVASALEWKVTATILPRVIPSMGGSSNKVIATGFHRLVITKILVQDTYWPVRFRVRPGELQRDENETDSCKTSWIYGWNQTSVRCVTKYTEEDCSSAYWEAWTWGELQWHPQGGKAQEVDGPVFANCACT